MAENHEDPFVKYQQTDYWVPLDKKPPRIIYSSWSSREYDWQQQSRLKPTKDGPLFAWRIVRMFPEDEQDTDLLP